MQLSSNLTVGYLEGLAVKLLAQIGIDTPLLDAQLLLGKVVSLSRLDIQLDKERKLSEKEANDFFKLLKRRLCFEPVAYLLGEKEFYGVRFHVSKDCLIPRPDTETVVEKCLGLINKDSRMLAYDLCTGSGAIAISMLCERPKLMMEASDICTKALKLAQKNAESHQVCSRLILRQGDLFAPYDQKKSAFLIVANPPYIASQRLAKLMPSVRDYEPKVALDAGGNTGIEFYRRILKEAPPHLSPGGFLVMEVGFDQKDALLALIGSPWHIIEFFTDLAGNARGIVLKKN